MPDVTPREVVERIERMFEAQLEGSDLHAALESLQESLIGAEALHELRAARFKAYQDAHPWLYPEIYGPVPRPPESQILTAAQVMSLALGELQKNLIRFP